VGAQYRCRIAYVCGVDSWDHKDGTVKTIACATSLLLPRPKDRHRPLRKIFLNGRPGRRATKPLSTRASLRWSCVTCSSCCSDVGAFLFQSGAAPLLDRDVFIFGWPVLVKNHVACPVSQYLDISANEQGSQRSRAIKPAAPSLGTLLTPGA
jgi:hypothetical protein